MEGIRATQRQNGREQEEGLSILRISMNASEEELRDGYLKKQSPCPTKVLNHGSTRVWSVHDSMLLPRPNS